MREEFENLKVISKRFNGLHPTIVWFCEKENMYASSFEGFQEMVHWLNGAWAVFQELNELMRVKMSCFRKKWKTGNVQEKQCLDLIRENNI